MRYAIETVNLSKEFVPTTNAFDFSLPWREEKKVMAINDVTLQVKKGEFFGLIGPNGSGKTTLAKVLSTLISPTRGTAYINGYSIIEDNKKVRHSVGLLITEERSFYLRLTGRQNLNFFAALYDLSSGQIRKRVAELGSLLEIEKYMDTVFYKCSSGIKQRFFIARALINYPPILILDDFTKNLDSEFADYLGKLIKEKIVCKQGKTVFFTTHNYTEAINLSDRLAVINGGKIINVDSPNKIIK